MDTNHIDISNQMADCRLFNQVTRQACHNIFKIFVTTDKNRVWQTNIEGKYLALYIVCSKILIFN
jgi:hypothetical protein